MRWSSVAPLASLYLLLGSIGAAGHTRTETDAVREQLMAQERAFAHHSVEHGMRAAFLEYFAENGVNFAPEPGNTRQRFLARPEGIEKFVLDWHPAIAVVSEAGDLGFTTGPYTLKGRSPGTVDARQGMFFSIWRKDAKGVWRVAVDGGISTDAPVSDAAFAGNPRTVHVAAADLKVEEHALFALEARALRIDAPASDAGAKATAALFADDARLIVGPGAPVIGPAAIFAELAARRVRFTSQTLDAGISKSADLAYTYGRLTLVGDRVSKPGYYVNVWIRDRQGQWKIVAELMMLPDEEKAS